METLTRLSALRQTLSQGSASLRKALREPADVVGSHWLYAVISIVLGIASAVLLLGTKSKCLPVDLSLVLTASATLYLTTRRPVPGTCLYFACWSVELSAPSISGADMGFITLGFFFVIGMTFPLWLAALVEALMLAVALLSPFWGGSDTSGLLSTMFFSLIWFVLLALGSLLRATEQTRRHEGLKAEERIAGLRIDIAREMHDLVAYSMSQTALRAQRAAADPTYPPEARDEFKALESTATDALHELRLLLRALRQSAQDMGQAVEISTGLGQAVTNLPAALQAICDDIAAAGFDVTFHQRGAIAPSRLQATTISRVAREMGANIIRHGAPSGRVTLTLALGPRAIRVVTTNQIQQGAPHLPTSGSGMLGMRERLATVGGSFTALAQDGAWIATASIPCSELPNPTTPEPQESTA